MGHDIGVTQRGAMPTDPNREIEVRKSIERTFADMELALNKADVGVLDVLQLYGGLDESVRRAQAYLTLLNPVCAAFSTSDSSVPRR